jgi:hypothetical protein
MKSLKKIALIAFALLIIPACAFGWSYRFVNNTTSPIVVHVYGEHLFWQQEDGTATINANSSAVINMPGGICGTYFTYDYDFKIGSKWYKGTESTNTGIGSSFRGATCWNVEIVISYIQLRNSWAFSRNNY